MRDFLRGGAWDFYCENFKEFVDEKEDAKPYDQSWLLALIAPGICVWDLRQESETSPGMRWIPAGQNRWLCDTIVGNGVVDVVACIKLLQESGYEGAYALEIGHEESFEEGVRRAMELCN